MRRFIALFLLTTFAWFALPNAKVGFGPSPAMAVQPDEMLADPALEARARQISEGLRCLVCQNQSIDDSNADLAKDLRVLVRQRLMAGDSDEDVRDYLVSRYGEFVLLKPRLEWKTVALWGMPVVVLIIGGLFLASGARRRRPAAPTALTADEEAAIADLLAQRKES